MAPWRFGRVQSEGVGGIARKLFGALIALAFALPVALVMLVVMVPVGLLLAAILIPVMGLVVALTVVSLVVAILAVPIHAIAKRFSRRRARS